VHLCPPSVGDWHVVKLIAKGSQLETWIDDARAGTYEIDIPAGSLLFQAAGDDAEVRNVTLDAPTPSGVIRPEEYEQRPGFTAPQLVTEVKPKYTANARANKVQGKVWLEAVVLTDGSVGGVWLTQLLHPELEHSALLELRRAPRTPHPGSRIPPCSVPCCLSFY